MIYLVIKYPSLRSFFNYASQDQIFDLIFSIESEVKRIKVYSVQKLKH